MDDELRFHIDRAGRVTGPVSDDDVRDMLRDGKLAADARLRIDGSPLWASARAFAALARSPGAARPTLPTAPETVAAALPADLAATPPALRDLLLFWVHEGSRLIGPISGAEVRRNIEDEMREMRGQLSAAAISLVDSGAWCKALLLAHRPVAPASLPSRESSISGAASSRAARTLYLGAAASGAAAPSSRGPSSQGPSSRGPASVTSVTSVTSDAGMTRCAICLEKIPASIAICPECGEPAAAPSGPASIPDDPPDASWLRMHWRPLITMGVMTTLVCTGIALRHLAPGRFLPPRAAKITAAASTMGAACSAPCWNGEGCKEGKCVWQPPNDVGHVAAAHEPIVGGPFPLPRDVSDALPLDRERFAAALLTGIGIYNARTGTARSLVTDAPQARGLYRVGSVVYATAPQRIYVVDPVTTRLLKTIETGHPVGEVVVGASGRRVLASLPTAHAIAVLATEYHAEIERIQFGDDPVGPMGADDTGTRALTTTGQIPRPGLRDPQGGAAYAFDPSRLASAQDRVRASMVGNPVSLLMTPDGQTSYVVLRAEDALVPLEWQPSGAVRQEARIPTCREPEEIALVRRGRRAIVRCNEGRSIEIFDLVKRELVRHVPFNARVADVAIAPDGEQAIVALPADGAGFVGLVNLESFEVKVLPVNAEPTRVRLSPDGSMALVLSDRAKVAWVIR